MLTKRNFKFLFLRMCRNNNSTNSNNNNTSKSHNTNSKAMVRNSSNYHNNTNNSSNSKLTSCNCKNSRWKSMEEIRSDISYCRNVAKYITPSSSSSAHIPSSTTYNNNNTNSRNLIGIKSGNGNGNRQLSEFTKYHKRYSMDNLFSATNATDIRYGSTYQVKLF